MCKITGNQKYYFNLMLVQVSLLRITNAISCYTCNEFPGEHFEDCSVNGTLANFGERKDVR